MLVTRRHLLSLMVTLCCRHVELSGYEFPFSRGASFYEVTDKGQILYGRDLVEPALKPGSSALLVGCNLEQQCCAHSV